MILLSHLSLSFFLPSPSHYLCQSTKRFTHSNCPYSSQLSSCAGQTVTRQILVCIITCLIMHTFLPRAETCYECRSCGSKPTALMESHGECSLEHFQTGSCSTLSSLSYNIPSLISIYFYKTVFKKQYKKLFLKRNLLLNLVSIGI